MIRIRFLSKLLCVGWLILPVAGTSCATGIGSLPALTPKACRDAGFTDAQIAGLISPLEAARDAGATVDEVLADVQAACEPCRDPAGVCDPTLCTTCFQQVVEEVFP